MRRALDFIGDAAGRIMRGVDSGVDKVGQGYGAYKKAVSPLEERITNSLPGKAFDHATGIVKDELYTNPINDLATLARGDISLNRDALSQIPGQLRGGRVRDAASSFKEGISNPLAYGSAVAGLGVTGTTLASAYGALNEGGVEALPGVAKDYAVGAGLSKYGGDIAGKVGRVADDLIVEPAAGWLGGKHGATVIPSAVEGAKNKLIEFEESQRNRPTRARLGNTSIVQGV